MASNYSDSRYQGEEMVESKGLEREGKCSLRYVSVGIGTHTTDHLHSSPPPSTKKMHPFCC